MIAETESWCDEACLTGVLKDDREDVRAAMSEFRNSLRKLHSAAESSDRRALRSSLDAMVTSYRHLEKLIGEAE